jgi:hypothetical protein
MALTKMTMTDEQRKSVALEYLKAFDNGGVTSSGEAILDLFASDAQVYFPKWGMATGKDEIGRLFGDVGGTLKSIVHHYSHFNWIFSGSDLVVCEGTSHGEHIDGPWRAVRRNGARDGGAMSSRSGTGSSSAASSIWIPTTRARTWRAMPGSAHAPKRPQNNSHAASPRRRFQDPLIGYQFLL